MTRWVTPEDLERTRAVLADLAQRQDELGAELHDTGLLTFVDRSEWLAAHRTSDEKLAAERAWARTARRHGIPVVARPPRAPAVHFDSLAVPKRVAPPRQVIDPDKALAIAERVLAQHPEHQASWKRARNRSDAA